MLTRRARISVEPLFHAEWERRAFALTLATGMLGQWNIDESRHARENQAPQRYLEQQLLRDLARWSAETLA